ncbi:uncharacterized protein LOC135393391 [Ornithodoros turicata]|uniref:uncharacterized protein LOC135393391 n=1 Tax=Ornithodoros turicata TaxID=34597 RepID=UPI003138D7BE
MAEPASETGTEQENENHGTSPHCSDHTPDQEESVDPMDSGTTDVGVAVSDDTLSEHSAFEDDFDIDDTAPEPYESSEPDTDPEDCFHEDPEDDNIDIAEFMEEYSETLPHQTTTKAQALLLILTFVVTAGLSWTQADGLLKLINALLGDKVLPNSKYMLRKLWNKNKRGILDLHYLCEACEAVLAQSSKTTEKSLTCHICSTKYDVADLTAAGSFFAILNIKGQLQSLLKRFSRCILENTMKIRSRLSSSELCDITDGSYYKNLQTSVNCQDMDLTVTLNSDGSQVFKSTASSLWPIQLMLNELPLPSRWHNIIVAGLWFSKAHPNMLLFLKAFVDKFNDMGPIPWRNFHTGEMILSTIRAVACVVDAPARAMVLNRKQYNGYDGCTWCYHPGKYVDGSVRYPYKESMKVRTHKEVLRDMKKATILGTTVNGIKGLSPVIQLKGLNLVRSIAPDYMHCALEGVIKQFTECWLTDSSAGCYIGGQLHILNSRLRTICPPICFSRLPRPLTERAMWKASEWKCWLLYYCAPCVMDVLPERFLNHFSLLCEAIFLLLKHTIQHSDISKAELLLERFVRETETLYTQGMCTYNVHQLLHLPETVRDLGPLWAVSMFPFESKNGNIIQQVTAANSVPLQIAERCAMRWKLFDLTDSVQLPSNLHIFRGPVTKTVCNMVLGRDQSPLGIPHAVQQLLSQHTEHVNLKRYLRASVKGVIIHSVQYKRTKRTCSRVVKSSFGTYCEVQMILKAAHSNKILFVCSELIIGSAPFPINHIMKCDFPPEGENICLLEDGDIDCVCVFMKADSMFVSELPNTFEIE